MEGSPAPIDEFGRAPFHYAALDGNVTVIAAFLVAGADVNVLDKRGWTPLHFAAQEWHAKVARLLVDHGAEVDAKNSDGNSSP